jgi:hypothetical protein
MDSIKYNNFVSYNFFLDNKNKHMENIIKGSIKIVVC